MTTLTSPFKNESNDTQLKGKTMREMDSQPQSSDEENRDGFGWYELTLLNKIAVRVRGRPKGWLGPDTLLIILLATR